MSARRRVGVIGTFVWDVIHGRDPHRAPVEEWGGIAYSLSAFDAALPDDWALVPLVKVGHDRAAHAREFVRSLRRVAPGDAPIEVPYRNNRVELVYRDAERRSEVLAGGVPGWSWIGLAPLLRDLDALYVNFISGFELDLDTLRLVRQQFRGPIYCDLHSLLLAVQPDGLRTPRRLADAAAWCACADFLQVNEDEMALLSDDPMAFASSALAAGAHTFVVTLGPRGIVYFAQPGFERIDPDALRPPRAALAPAPGPIRTARVPSVPAHDAQGGDPTGCGDVWGATFFSRLLAGDKLSDAVRVALASAARNVEHRGATGLAHHLRGELSPT
jgi:hypothetical protein